LLGTCLGLRDQRPIGVCEGAEIDARNLPVEAFLENTRDDAVHEVAETVRKLAVIAIDEIAVAEITVLTEADLAHEIVSEHVSTERFDERSRWKEVP
jgi:hypothetical protein